MPISRVERCILQNRKRQPEIGGRGARSLKNSRVDRIGSLGNV
ncbi:hypothetical protein CKA32_000826 [Geitlerinema sp. FC II]|nr:hypothetical protein CKA32_000826 [Geitlerinema sp. FC II]